MNQQNRSAFGRLCILPLLLLATLILGGCGEERTTSNRDSVNKDGFYARFDPANGVLPFPNNLLFSGSSDGTLNIPVADASDYSDPQVALNTLDGFSTVAPITVQLSSGIDSETLVAGETVRLFEVTLSGTAGAVTAITRELVAETDYTVTLSPVDSTEATISILPLQPLTPASSYLVTLSRGLQDTLGNSATPELPYALAKESTALIDGSGASRYSALSDEQAQALEPVRQLTNTAEAAVEAYTIDSDTAETITDLAGSDIVLSWSFTTQSIGGVLSKIWSSAAPGTVTTTDSGLTTAEVQSGLPGLADIHVGTLALPYYLEAPSESDPSAPLTGYWKNAAGGPLSSSTTPVATSSQSVPLLLTLPNANSGNSMPSGGWPVVIFQHGITQDRSNLLAVADTLAAAGFAAVAIDMPLHGITDSSNPLYVAGGERTFDLDLVDNTTKAAGSDGLIDESGAHYLNLTSLLVGRDNLRQSVADLMTLYQSLGNIANLNEGQVYFVGHSLGAMVGLPFLSLETAVQDAVLAMPGGAIPRLLDGSASFGPEMETALAAAGVVKGSADYESFLDAAQTVLDPADPINYTATVGTSRGLLLFEVVGGNSSLADQTIPNNLWSAAPAGTTPSPLAGTDPLAELLGLEQYIESSSGSNLQAWMRFNAGHHGSLLTPYDADGNEDELSALVTTEMQSQMATFLASGGTALGITDSSVIAGE